MNGKEQVKILIESLELRLKQVKTNEEDLNLDVLVYAPCPLCKAMGLESIHDKDGDGKCSKCIAQVSDVCSEYTVHVLRGNRTKLLKWLRYQIKRWKKLYSQIDSLREKLEQWNIDWD